MFNKTVVIVIVIVLDMHALKLVEPLFYHTQVDHLHCVLDLRANIVKYFSFIF